MGKGNKKKKKKGSSDPRINGGWFVPPDFKKCYIPLMDDPHFEWRWEEELVLAADQMWQLGYSPFKMASVLDRDPDEILILLVDRLRKEKIRMRAGGIIGTIS